MGNLVYLEGFQGLNDGEGDRSGAARRPMPVLPHQNPYAPGTKPWGWWDSGYYARRTGMSPLRRDYEKFQAWTLGRQAGEADGNPLRSQTGLMTSPFPGRTPITVFIDRPQDIHQGNLQGVVYRLPVPIPRFPRTPITRFIDRPLDIHQGNLQGVGYRLPVPIPRFPRTPITRFIDRPLDIHQGNLQGVGYRIPVPTPRTPVTRITRFIDRPRDLHQRDLPSLYRNPRDSRERRGAGASALGAANPYWKPGAGDGKGPTAGPGGQQYATHENVIPTRKDGYVYSAEYWEDLHQVELLTEKLQPYLGNMYDGKPLPPGVAELVAAHTAANQLMRDKTDAAVKANDPELWALQQAGLADRAAYYASLTNAPADMTSGIPSATGQGLNAQNLVDQRYSVVDAQPVDWTSQPQLKIDSPQEEWQRDMDYLRSLGYFDTPMPSWDESTQTFWTPQPRQGSALDYALWKKSADFNPEGQSPKTVTPNIPAPTPIYPLPAPPPGTQDFAPVPAQVYPNPSNYTNATPIPTSHASPDPYRNLFAPAAYAVPDQGLRYRGSPLAPAASPIAPAPAETEGWLQSSSIIPSVKNLYLVSGLGVLALGFFLLRKSTPAA
jgi:hypothetical protein